jgi:hypothetical protein
MNPIRYICLVAFIVLAHPSPSSSAYKNQVVELSGSGTQVAASSQGNSQSSSPVSIAAVKTAFASVPVSNVTLNAQVTYIQGGVQEQGAAVLVAKGDGSYEIDYDLKSGPKSEIQTAAGDDQTCTWTDQVGTVHTTAQHNCFSATAWFLPQVSLLSTVQPSVTLTSVGNIDVNGQSLWDIRKSATFNSSHSSALLAKLSTVDLLIDPSTSLVSALKFATHPDSDANRDIPVRIDFSDYRSVSGVSVPYHIQKYMNGTLMLDITVSNASIQ